MKPLPRLLALLAGLLPLAPATALDQAAFIAMGASVLRVEVPRADGRLSIGSGVAVAPERIVTNCHVTRDARSIQVVRGAARWSVFAQSSDLDRDLCLLQVPGLQARTVPLGRAADLSVGQPVTALGYTGGIGMQNSRGEVIELHRHDGARVIQTSNRFNSGASGGGLFDDDGRLVGILTFRLRGGAEHYFAAPVEWVQRLLANPDPASFEAVAPLESPQRAFWERSATAQPRFLQAAVLRRDYKWSELAMVAIAWLRADAADGEPWYLLGVALEHLHQPIAARLALECALRVEPTPRAARRWLASLFVREQPDDLFSESGDCRLADRRAR
jgi:serine protease Do